MDDKVEITQSQSVTVRLDKIRTLAKLTSDLQSNAKSPKTVAEYASDWSDFAQWCEQHGLCPLPAAPEAIAAYLADRATNPYTIITNDSRRGRVTRAIQRLRPSTLKRRLEAICDRHKESGHTLDRSSACIANTMKGIERTVGRAQEQKAPLTTEDIRKAIAVIDIGPDEEPKLKGMRDRALLLLGFMGAFRRSELVAVQVDDLRWVEEGLEVTVRRSKTDQSGEGMVKIIPYGKDPVTCPIRCLKQWLRLAGIESGPVFRGVNRHGHVSSKSLTPHAVGLIIKGNGHVKGLAGGEHAFSSHSLRAGFCTSAAMEGASVHAIMRQTDHRTPATTMKYIRIANRWKQNAAVTIPL